MARPLTLLHWNLRHVHRHQLPAIAAALAQLRPDAVAVAEWRSNQEPALLAVLAAAGLAHVVTTPLAPGRRGLLLAASQPVERLGAWDADAAGLPRGSLLLTARLRDAGLEVAVLHVVDLHHRDTDPGEPLLNELAAPRLVLADYQLGPDGHGIGGCQFVANLLAGVRSADLTAWRHGPADHVWRWLAPTGYRLDLALAPPRLAMRTERVDRPAVEGLRPPLRVVLAAPGPLAWLRAEWRARQVRPEPPPPATRGSLAFGDGPRFRWDDPSR